MHGKAGQVPESKMAHQIEAYLFHELLWTLQSCHLSIKKDAGKEGAKPVSRGKTISELSTSHLPMKPQSPITASQREKDRDSHASSCWSLARVCDLQEAPIQDARKNLKQNQNQPMLRTSSEDRLHWWDIHRPQRHGSQSQEGACDEALLGRSFHKTKTLPFKSAEAVKHVPEELLQLMVKSSVFQWE